MFVLFLKAESINVCVFDAVGPNELSSCSTGWLPWHVPLLGLISSVCFPLSYVSISHACVQRWRRPVKDPQFKLQTGKS